VLQAQANASKGQPVSNEAPAESPTAEAPAPSSAPEDPLSSHYANLARKEKALRAKESQIKAREAAIRAKEEAAKPQTPAAPAFDESKYIPKDLLKSNALQALADAGVSYEEITELMLNQPAQQDAQRIAYERRLEAKLQELESKQAAVQKSIEQQQTTAYQQALRQIKSEVSQLVDTDPGFETIKATGSVSDVVDLIEKTFNKDNVLLSVEEAAQAVEDYLVEEATKLAKIEKIQKRLKPNASSQASVEKPQPDDKKQQLKTLTNAVGVSRQLTAKERAVLAFKGEKF
jgi:hypothetical protein